MVGTLVFSCHCVFSVYHPSSTQGLWKGTEVFPSVSWFISLIGSTPSFLLGMFSLNLMGTLLC